MAKKKTKTKKRATAKYKRRPLAKNPAKLKRVTKSSGWLKADAVRFVKKHGRMEVFIRRNKKRRKAK